MDDQEAATNEDEILDDPDIKPEIDADNQEETTEISEDVQMKEETEDVKPEISDATEEQAETGDVTEETNAPEEAAVSGTFTCVIPLPVLPGRCIVSAIYYMSNLCRLYTLLINLTFHFSTVNAGPEDDDEMQEGIRSVFVYTPILIPRLNTFCTCMKEIMFRAECFKGGPYIGQNIQPYSFRYMLLYLFNINFYLFI